MVLGLLPDDRVVEVCEVCHREDTVEVNRLPAVQNVHRSARVHHRSTACHRNANMLTLVRQMAPQNSTLFLHCIIALLFILYF